MDVLKFLDQPAAPWNSDSFFLEGLLVALELGFGEGGVGASGEGPWFFGGTVRDEGVGVDVEGFACGGFEGVGFALCEACPMSASIYRNIRKSSCYL